MSLFCSTSNTGEMYPYLLGEGNCFGIFGFPRAFDGLLLFLPYALGTPKPYYCFPLEKCFEYNFNSID